MNTKTNVNTKRLTQIAIFVAIALILSVLESFLAPLFMLAQGAKMGLANVVILVCLVSCGFLNSLFVQLIRCTLGAILTGGISSLMFSLPAGIMSLIVMYLLYKFIFPKLTLTSISFLSALTHNYTQLLIAHIIYPDTIYAFLLANYMLASTVSGIFVGLTAYLIIKYLPKRFITN